MSHIDRTPYAFCNNYSKSCQILKIFYRHNFQPIWHIPAKFWWNSIINKKNYEHFKISYQKCKFPIWRKLLIKFRIPCMLKWQAISTTTDAQSVPPFHGYMLVTESAIVSLLGQRFFDKNYAILLSSALSVEWHCLSVCGIRVPAVRSISNNRPGWGPDCLVATKEVK